MLNNILKNPKILKDFNKSMNYDRKSINDSFKNMKSSLNSMKLYKYQTKRSRKDRKQKISLKSILVID